MIYKTYITIFNCICEHTEISKTTIKPISYRTCANCGEHYPQRNLGKYLQTMEKIKRTEGYFILPYGGNGLSCIYCNGTSNKNGKVEFFREEEKCEKCKGKGKIIYTLKEEG